MFKIGILRCKPSNDAKGSDGDKKNPLNQDFKVANPPGVLTYHLKSVLDFAEHL